MTISAVALVNVLTESRGWWGRRKEAEMVIAARPLEPGSYRISHGQVTGLVVDIGSNDSVAVRTRSLANSRNRAEIVFAGRRETKESLLAAAVESASVVPAYGRSALRLHPDSDGIKLAFMRHLGDGVLSMRVAGTLALNGVTALTDAGGESGFEGGGGVGGG